jgi:hypothetical protein
MRRIENNPRTNQQLESKINKLSAHMKNQEEESKKVRGLLEGHKKNIAFNR